MQWIKCSDRLPTEADGDAVGDVVCRDCIGSKVDIYTCAWFNAEVFNEWLAGACERTEVVFNQKEESK